MGCSSCNKPQVKMDIKDFNNKYNENISKNITLYQFNNIEDEGFNIFCTFDLKNLEQLFLSNNSISKIDSFKNMDLPKLTKLDLSYNKIKNINVFAKVKYPLEELDLRNNVINNIDIFKKKDVLPKLNRLFLKNNDINFEDKEIKAIIDKCHERMTKNEEKNNELTNEEQDKEFKNDEMYSKVLKSIKTLNSKNNCDIGIFDKNAITRLKTLRDSEGQKNKEEYNMVINEIPKLSIIKENIA